MIFKYLEIELRKTKLSKVENVTYFFKKDKINIKIKYPIKKNLITKLL